MLLLIVNTLIPIFPRRYLIFGSKFMKFLIFFPLDAKVLKSNLFLGVVVNDALIHDLGSQRVAAKSSNTKRSTLNDNTCWC